jgi:hypothetical protein
MRAVDAWNMESNAQLSGCGCTGVFAFNGSVECEILRFGPQGQAPEIQEA